MIRIAVVALGLLATTACGAGEVREASGDADSQRPLTTATSPSPRVQQSPLPAPPLEIPGPEEVEAWAVEHQEELIGLVGAQKKLENATQDLEAGGPLIKVEIAAIELSSAVIRCKSIPSPPDPNLQPTWREALEHFRLGANLMRAAAKSEDADLYDEAVAELGAAAAAFGRLGELI